MQTPGVRISTTDIRRWIPIPIVTVALPALWLAGVGYILFDYTRHLLRFDFWSYFTQTEVGPVAAVLTSAALGIVLIWKRPTSWLGLLSTYSMVAGLAILYDSSPAWVRFSSVLYPIFFGYLFPDGRFVPSWTRWLAVACLGYALLAFVLPRTITLGSLYYLAAGVSIVAALLLRSRQGATPVQRQQIKISLLGWLFYLPAMVVVIAANVLLSGAPEAARLSLTVLQRLAIEVQTTVAVICFGLAIMRYGLYGADIALNRVLVYTGLLIVLALAYGAAFVGLRALLSLIITGEQAVLEAVGATAVVAALFNPSRLWLQRLVDQRVFGLRQDLNQIQAHQAQQRSVPGLIHMDGIYTGQVFDCYQLGELLGQGGMAEVYRGHHTNHGRPVAVKVISSRFAGKNEARIRFLREAQALTLLRHPNIVTLIDFGTQGDLYYMVMEYIEGEDLDDTIYARGALPVDETASILWQIAGAMDYAHQQGLVHRDVKAANVRLESNGHREVISRAVLMDFGVTKILKSLTVITQDRLLGTLDYAAPEQILSAGTVDWRADIYAMGVTAYHMLAGELPFQGPVAQLVFAHLRQPVPDLRRFNPSLPDHVVAAVERAMAKEPSERWQSAREFAAAFDPKHAGATA